MVSISNLLTQRESELRTVESQLTEQEETIFERERKLGQEQTVFLQKTKPLPLTLKRQESFAKIVGRGEVARAAKQIRRQKKEARGIVLPKFAEAREQLVSAKKQITFERGRLIPIKAELREAREFEFGRKIAFDTDPRAIFALQTEKEREGFRAGTSQVKAAEQRLALLKIGRPIIEDGKLLAFDIAKEGRTVTLEGLSQEQLVSLEKVGVLTFKTTTTPLGDFQTKVPTEPKFEKFIKDFSLFGARISEPSIVGIGPFGFRSESFIEAKAGIISGFIPKTKGELIVTAVSAGVGGILGVGLKTGGVLLTKFAPKLIRPAEIALGTIGLGAGGFFAFEKGKQFIAAETPFIKGEVLGETVREVTAFAGGLKVGGKAVTFTQDIFRTRGLVEVPPESVIAPEFFAGESFPKIKPGQTAGQLRSEFFKPIGEIGEFTIVPRGFTALATEPLKIIPKGDSFVFGSFSAPRVSPHFLRVTGAEEGFKFFSFRGFLDAGRPTIARTEFINIGFAPGITTRTKFPTGRTTPELLEFFGGGLAPGVKFGKPFDLIQPKAPKGQSFIPFVKTEKESVLPFGTLIKETGRRFFIKFEGRKIPIAELKALPELKISEVKTSFGEKTLGEFLESSSRIQQEVLVTPDIGGISLISSPGKGISSFRTSFIPKSSSRPFVDISSTSPIPESRRGPISKRDPLSIIIPPASSSRIPPRRPRPTPFIPSIIPEFPGRTERPRPRKKKKVRRSARRKKIITKKKKVKRRKTPIRPSFTAIVAELKGGLPEITKIGDVEVGILPSRLRRLPGKSKKRKKK